MGFDLGTCRLRASSSFTLRGFDELEVLEQERLQSLRDDPDLFGVLLPESALLPAKSVSKEAALLFLALQRPQRIPLLLAAIFGDDLGPLHALVADGVFEMEHEGVFVSGPEALDLFAMPGLEAPALGPTAKLSSEAIRVAAGYPDLDASQLAQKLYAFGRLPCTSAIRRRFATDADLLSFLCAEEGVADHLSSGWNANANADGQSPWLWWGSFGASPHLGHKLYVSAQIEAIPRVFALALRALKRTGCTQFKIGRRAEGMCRPDKMVAYFSSLDELRECAARIESDLGRSDVSPCLAHGVPFAAGIDAAGFLAWGMDPPELTNAAELRDVQSWRQWIAARVAIAILSAKASVRGDDLVAFVLQRIALEGIDPQTWSPNLALWRDHAAGSSDTA
jgi:hypothetical protein